MVFNTLSVGAAVTPSVIETYFSHYLNRAPLRQKPTAHISYHEGLRLIRQFLDYSSKHSIEDLQSFTAQWVPAPHWVRINDAEVAPKFLERAARLIHAQLGTRGLAKIGGKTWWQWRRPDAPLRAEWIEMKKEYHERKRTGDKCERVILYVHGGAYYFGSVDEHRYQMQRHARKLRARVLAPRYRLAPQFPFPCGLYDCLATYFYLLEHFEPNQILFAGDSAGGGMVLAMLVALRDQGQPLPAGTILLSPWCDLTHSFPSVAGDGTGDYIPPHGFHHKPSMAWPPPPSDGVQRPETGYGQQNDAVELPATAGMDMKKTRSKKRSVDDEGDEDLSALPSQGKRKQESMTALPMPQFGHPLSIVVDGQTIDLRDQIQMYTTNELLSHPLVSPVMQPSLGGLPPMLIQVGGGELLRDEQIYVAHKAANPKAYPPSEMIMKEFDPSRTTLERYPPTNVQLQVWDDLCHVPHTLSFTRPAKYMYRSVAQFGAWALAHAQQKGIDIPNDDAVSFISSEGEDEDDSKSTVESVRKERKPKASATEKEDDAAGAVGKAGDPLPSFKDNMIRQRVTRHGNIFPLAPESEMACLALDPAAIGVIKPGPVRKWLAVKATNDTRFANDRKKIMKRREKEISAGYDAIPGENPPPTAIVNRRRKGVAPEEKKRGKSWGLAMWSGWGSSHDEHTLQREQKTVERKMSMSTTGPDSESKSASRPDLLTVPKAKHGRERKRRNSSVSMLTTQMPWAARDRDRPMSPYSRVNDTGQADDVSYSSPALSHVIPRPSTSSAVPSSRRISSAADSPIPYEGSRASRAPEVMVPTMSTVHPDSEKIPGSENTFLAPTSSRPHDGVRAYPFKLESSRSNPSVATLDSREPTGTSTPHSELVGDAPKTSELSGERRSVQDLRSVSAVGADDEPEAVEARETTTAPEERVEEPRDVVSPVEEGKEVRDEGAVSPVDSSTKPKPFKIRNTIFDPRVSMLGSIGADGMPNAHHDFPTRSTDMLVDPAATEEKSEADTASTTLRGDSLDTQRVPFKVRNPVFDARAPAPSIQPSENTPPAETSKPAETTKSAPFKLRHTLDPATIASTSPAEEPAVPTPPPQQQPRPSRFSVADSAPEVVRSSASSTGTDMPPPAYESMPMNNVVMPETVSNTRSVVREKDKDNKSYDDDRPPTPPPKDDKPMFLKNSGRKASSKDRGGRPPVIGGLSFESQKRRNGSRERPQLESFVTARDGRNVRGS
ncbi:uncharacterized protein LTR77_005572 [Saxophila tyrrhenica]|uniref:Alpha/beta hydrolase fold-3 domain-containing protein n=1 Tax=Saxophila tyrrhenica TaxID=1690608 RepID=A0AAV9PD03_9PEZI|nr:hypothetical protein LTR77_005572 [Saxophila tyrrhenica]